MPHYPALELIAIRSILSSAGRCGRSNTRVDGFRRLHWSWQESLLSTMWPFVPIALVPGISLASIGVTSRFRPGWLKASIVASIPLS